MRQYPFGNNFPKGYFFSILLPTLPFDTPDAAKKDFNAQIYPVMPNSVQVQYSAKY